MSAFNGIPSDWLEDYDPNPVPPVPPKPAPKVEKSSKDDLKTMKIYSFGFRYGLKLDGTHTLYQASGSKERQAYQRFSLGGLSILVVDVRLILPKNPYHNKALRKLRGDDEEVILELEKTPGLESAYTELLGVLQANPYNEVYVGCTGGHHRSVYIANRLGADLNCPVLHLNYNDK